MCFERTVQPHTLRLSAKHWETKEIGIYLLRTNEKMANELYKAIDYRLNRLKHLVEKVSLEEKQAAAAESQETNNESSQNYESTEDGEEKDESSQASSQPEVITSSQEDSVSRTSTQMSAQRINTSESNESQEI